MRKRVSVTDFDGYRISSRMCGSHGKGASKSVEVITEPTTKRVWFVTVDHGTDVYTGPSLEEALELYNNL